MREGKKERGETNWFRELVCVEAVSVDVTQGLGGPAVGEENHQLVDGFLVVCVVAWIESVSNYYVISQMDI